MTYSPKTNRLFVITEHFEPSTGATAQLTSDLTRYLFDNGINITVLTSSSGKHDLPFPVIRFSQLPEYRIGILNKLYAGTKFFFGTILWLFLHLRSSDSLFIVSNPPFIGLIGPIFFLLRGASYRFLCQDIFPRSAVLTGLLPAKGPVVTIWRSLIKLVFTLSDTTITLSDSMKHRCQKDFGIHPNKIVVIPNWSVVTPSDLKKPLCVDPTPPPFTLQYSGNFGRLHDLLTILEAARLLKNEHITFDFIGAGAKQQQILHYKEVYGLQNIHLKPYQSRAALPQSLSSCDASFVSLIPGSEDTVAPSKLYGILAFSKPVLLICSPHSSIAKSLTDSGSGLVCSQGDVRSLVENILTLFRSPEARASMSRNALKLYRTRYQKKVCLASYLKLFTHPVNH